MTTEIDERIVRQLCEELDLELVGFSRTTTSIALTVTNAGINYPRIFTIADGGGVTLGDLTLDRLERMLMGVMP